MQFENEDQFVVIGEEKVYLNDLYKAFIKTIVTEMIQQLHYQQKLVRLKILYNQNKHTSIDEKHKFYLSKQQSIDLKDQLYDLYDQIKDVEKVKIDMNDIDFSKLSAMDFIEPDGSKLYERLFVSNELNKKK